MDSDQWPNYVRIPFQYGIYAGLIAFPFMLMLYHTGRHPLLVDIFLDYRILLLSVAILLSLKEVRGYNEGNLYFWQGMAGSLVLTCVFATLASVLIYVYMIFDADFLHSYLAGLAEQLKTSSEEVINQVGKDAYEENLKSLPKINAYSACSHFFAQSFAISLFVSIIISVLLRRHTNSTSPRNDRKA